MSNEAGVKRVRSVSTDRAIELEHQLEQMAKRIRTLDDEKQRLEQDLRLLQPLADQVQNARMCTICQDVPRFPVYQACGKHLACHQCLHAWVVENHFNKLNDRSFEDLGDVTGSNNAYVHAPH